MLKTWILYGGLLQGCLKPGGMPQMPQRSLLYSMPFVGLRKILRKRPTKVIADQLHRRTMLICSSELYCKAGGCGLRSPTGGGAARLGWMKTLCARWDDYLSFPKPREISTMCCLSYNRQWAFRVRLIVLTLDVCRPVRQLAGLYCHGLLNSPLFLVKTEA